MEIYDCAMIHLKQDYGCQDGLQMEGNSRRKNSISNEGLKKLKLLLIYSSELPTVPV
jgi:hypothetical protein